MKWIEIIEFRSVGSNRELLESHLQELIQRPSFPPQMMDAQEAAGFVRSILKKENISYDNCC